MYYIEIHIHNSSDKKRHISEVLKASFKKNIFLAECIGNEVTSYAIYRKL